MRRETDNANWGGARPGAGRPRRNFQIQLDADLVHEFRKAHEESIGRIINNGEFDEALEDFINKSLRSFIDAPKPEPKWTVWLFWDGPHDGKLLREAKDLSEEEALKFAVEHQNVEVCGYLCNRTIAKQQGSRTNERRWSSRHDSDRLRWTYGQKRENNDRD